MLKQHELIDRLHALDKLFVDLYNYAERERDKIRAGEGNAVYALNSIRNTIGGRYNVIPQAASAIDRLSTQVEELRGALRDSYDALRRHCDWEADLIMSELEVDSIPAPTPEIWDKLTDDLQPFRNAAMDRAKRTLVETT